MNSFHFRTMYRFSSITEFQHSTAPMRSLNEPPSRKQHLVLFQSGVGFFDPQVRQQVSHVLGVFLAARFELHRKQIYTARPRDDE